MKVTFNKELPTIITKDGVHYLCDKNGIVKGQVESIVTNGIDTDHKDNIYSEAKITFHVNLCGSLDEALKKYKE